VAVEKSGTKGNDAEVRACWDSFESSSTDRLIAISITGWIHLHHHGEAQDDQSGELLIQ
jgi:hypothetical protein